MKVNVFFPSFDMCKEGKGVNFFHNFFSIIKWLRTLGVMVFFLLIC